MDIAHIAFLEATMFSRILVPTDFSEPSDAALEYARSLATKFGSTLHLLHMIDAPFANGQFGSEVFIAETPAIEAELFEEAKAKLAHRVTPSDKARFNATTEVIVGSSPRGILDYATERAMDLIVMGTHGRSGMAHLLMGSVAEKVVRSAPCPVLTVRQVVSRESVPIIARVATA
jgi:nucleotide-binding universal stress UspA family protein